MKLKLNPRRVHRICLCVLILMLLLFAGCGGSDDSGSADQAGGAGTGGQSSTSISQFGITWSFDRELFLGTDYGQFASELDDSKLARLDPPASAPSLADVESAFERPWVANRKEYTSNYLHPAGNMSTYGREIANDVGIGSLMLNLDFDDSAKELLLIRFVQVGIDLYSIVTNGGKDNFINNGGCHPGMKWPVLFAGIVLNNDDMKNIGQKSGDYLYAESYGPGNAPPDYIHFQEDDQTFHVTQSDVDITNGPAWSPDSRDAEVHPYETGDLGMPAINPGLNIFQMPTAPRIEARRGSIRKRLGFSPAFFNVGVGLV
jgi:hypothetical protein